MSDHCPLGYLFISSICLVHMNVFAKFDNFPSMTLQDIKKTKRYGHTFVRSDNVKTVYPPTNTVCGGYNYDGLDSPMLHTKFHENPPAGSGEDFRRVFTIYGRVGHLGHVTHMPQTNFLSPYPRKLQIKFGFDRASGFGEEDV